MKFYFITLLFFLFSMATMSQVTIGSGSMPHARSMVLNIKPESSSHRINLPNSKSIIPEDFFNYHKHDITIPSTQDVALSIDYDNVIFDKESGDILVQVGIATQPAYLRESKRNNVNISLVVDVSGSMGGMKIELVKKSLRKFVSALQNEDKLSIVVFSSDAKLLLPVGEVGENKTKINKIIDTMTPDGMTNLNAGMLMGYEEALKAHSSLTNSRVILMTDGETNMGEKNLDKIIENSLRYNKEGIEISTIGIGRSLDFDLLRELADAGKGSNYYIGEHDEDIYKIFDQELDGILYKIGSNQKVEIELPKGWNIEQCYGYETKSTLKDNKIELDLENLGASSTRIILLRVHTDKRNETSNELAVNAKLSYTRLGKNVVLEKNEPLRAEHSYSKELKKNYEIAFMAESLKEVCKSNELGRSYRAESAVDDAVKWMSESSNYEDGDFQRVFQIIKQYDTAIKSAKF